jgi:acyl-CoA reductase-like NAD-dependent aldehyde dehydrogenase
METLEAGTIGINDGVASTSQCPFGGVKQNGGAASWAAKDWTRSWRPGTSRST